MYPATKNNTYITKYLANIAAANITAHFFIFPLFLFFIFITVIYLFMHTQLAGKMYRNWETERKEPGWRKRN